MKSFVVVLGKEHCVNEFGEVRGVVIDAENIKEVIESKLNEFFSYIASESKPGFKLVFSIQEWDITSKFTTFMLEVLNENGDFKITEVSFNV